MDKIKKIAEERVLIEACVRNERAAQEKLYKQYFPKMLQLCFRYTNDRDKAMEIVNNGFLRVFKKIDTFAFAGSFEGWMRKLVFHCISDHFRKENKYINHFVLEEKEKVTTVNALDQLYAEDILDLIANLPSTSQSVFRMFAIEGYSHKEISEKLNFSEGNSKWHLSQARKILKDQLFNNRNKLYAG